MSSNMTTLLKQAAELRASGHSWEQIGKKLHRKGKTCKGWPQVYASQWQPIYREIQLQRFDQMAQECRDRLHALCRNEDLKIQQRALEFVSRHGAQAYGANGSIAPPAASAPVEETKPASPSAAACAEGFAILDEEWARINVERAKEGQPPLTADEFFAQYNREYEERANRKQFPMYYDEETHRVEPPDDCSPPLPSGTYDPKTGIFLPDSRSPLPGDTLADAREGPLRQAGPTPNRDVMWGVLLFAVMLTGRGPAPDDRSITAARFAAPEGRPKVARGEAQRNPWNQPAFLEESSPVGAQDSFAPPGLGCNGIGVADSRGCAAIHPWLRSVAPSVLKNRDFPPPGLRSRPSHAAEPGDRSPPMPGLCHPSIIAESFEQTGARTMSDQKGKGNQSGKKQQTPPPTDDKKITPMEEDYSQWYLDIVRRAELADNSDVRGCMVIRPNGYTLWENMQRAIDGLFKATGHVNAYFPLFIPKSFFQKEEQMAEGFAKECAVVTHYRLKSKDGKIEVDPEAKLEEELIIRPTSETIIWNTYKGWIQSYRDLPILINQWCNVVRWEMRTRLFLRTAEFLWQEGHTAHATQKEAEEETLPMVNVYRQFAEEWMAMPVLVGPKSEGQKFPGAVYTLCIEALMQDGKALQSGTSHFLGQNFSKAFDVQFTTEEGKREYPWATSWGASTRLIGGLIMTHSDDNGLVVPPRLAPTHVVICPMGRNDEERAPSIAAAEKLESAITALPRDDFYGYQPLKVRIDRDFKNMPGHRFAEWELRGVPVRVEIGPKDIEKNACVLARRDIPGKEGKTMGVPLDGAPARIDALLREIQKNLFDRSKTFRDSTFRTANTYDEFKQMIEEPGFIWAHWDGTRATEDKIQEDTKATIRVIPFDGPKEPGKCIVTGKPSERRVVFARAY